MTDSLDSNSGTLFAFYDEGTKMVYLAGKVRLLIIVMSKFDPVLCCKSVIFSNKLC